VCYHILQKNLILQSLSLPELLMVLFVLLSLALCVSVCLVHTISTRTYTHILYNHFPYLIILSLALLLSLICAHHTRTHTHTHLRNIALMSNRVSLSLFLHAQNLTDTDTYTETPTNTFQDQLGDESIQECFNDYTHFSRVAAWKYLQNAQSLHMMMIGQVCVYMCMYVCV